MQRRRYNILAMSLLISLSLGFLGCGSENSANDNEAANLFDSLQTLPTDNAAFRAKLTIQGHGSGDLIADRFETMLEAAKLKSNNDAAELDIINGPVALDLARPVAIGDAVKLHGESLNGFLRLFFGPVGAVEIDGNPYAVKWPSQASSGFKVDINCELLGRTLIDIDILSHVANDKLIIHPVAHAECISDQKSGDDSNSSGDESSDEEGGGNNDSGSDTGSDTESDSASESDSETDGGDFNPDEF